MRGKKSKRLLEMYFTERKRSIYNAIELVTFNCQKLIHYVLTLGQCMGSFANAVLI